jgi:cardiolipin synthase
VKWWTLHKAQNRSHVRAVVIDGLVGFTGGFGIDDRWGGDGRHPEQWRDTNVRVRGPAVAYLQAAFDRAWTEATGSLLVGEMFFPVAPVHPPSDSARPPSGQQSTTPSVPAQMGVVAGLLHSIATFGPTANARLFALTVAGARHSLFISNAYFVPDQSMLEHLEAASKRGVDVRLLLPGEQTDVPMTRSAARSWYAQLIRSGVKVYEYQPSMLHAKTFVVDGMFTSIGSMNLDYRSFALNDEANMLILDRSFGARMDSLYLEDLKYSKQIDLATFEKRGFREKLKEKFARAIGRAL